MYRMMAHGKSWSGNERHCVFLNTGRLPFVDVSAMSGLDFADDGRGMAYVDWDHDGDPDLWMVNRSAPQVRFMRNDTPTDNHHLVVRLRGKTSNRDAIGARVEVHLSGHGDQDGTILIKTLTAGHGFLSQSSKWMHFGLGRRSQIDRLVVRWPGGEAETFVDMQADRHYKIVEGGGSARRWMPPAGRAALVPSKFKSTAAPRGQQIFLASRMPLPLLSYRDLTGQDREISLNDQIDSPTLVNLWASWCLPCAVELKQFVEAEKRFGQAQLKVIALSVDGLDPAKKTDAGDARRFLENIGFPFDSGLADAVMLTKLQLLLDQLFYNHISHPTPMSFLIDRNGRLAAVYRGPVEVDRLLEDVARLDADAVQRRQMNASFDGRWLGRPMVNDPVPLAETFYGHGFPLDAVMYCREAVLLQPDNPDTHANLGFRLHQVGQSTEALESFDRALQLKPTDPGVYYNMAVVLQAAGDMEQAVERYRQVLQINPNYVSAHNNLGNALRLMGKYDDAIEHFNRAIELWADNINARHNLALTHLLQGRTDDAIAGFYRVLQINPDLIESRLHLAVGLQLQARLEEAELQYKHCLLLKPDSSEVHYRYGVLLKAAGRIDEAIGHWRRALEISPRSAVLLNDLSWTLATDDNPLVRKPGEAISLAKRAAALTKHRHPPILDTLAAAYAAAGQYEDAVATAQQAIDLAKAANVQAMADQIHNRMELYRGGKPYIEATQPLPSAQP